MKRSIVLGVLVVAGVLAIVVAAQQPQNAPMVIEVEKLKDNLYVLKGGGGNTAVFVQSNGVTVVDSKNPGWGQPILDKMKTLTNKPVTTLINTHTHGDHVSGNVAFPATVDIVTQENTAENMKKMVAPYGFPPATGNIFQQNGGRGMPKRTFKTRMTIGKGDDRIDLYYFGRAHTNGDAWVLFPALRVAHAGDAFSGKNIPLIDANNGGSAKEFPGTLKKAYNSLKGADTFITGHSTQMTRPDLQEYAQFNLDFWNDMSAARKSGKTVDQVATSWAIPAKYKGYAKPDPVRLKNNMQIAFDELSGKNPAK